jgi:large subunit ribosomal protein L18
MSLRRLSKVTKNRLQRAGRVRSTVSGTAERPRLSVHISNRHIVAQVIDDTTSKTLAYATTVGRPTDKKTGETMTDRAIWIGNEIAKQAKTAKVTVVVFDRGSKLYHGRVAALADAARKSGLEF